MHLEKKFVMFMKTKLNLAKLLTFLTNEFFPTKTNEHFIYTSDMSIYTLIPKHWGKK